MKKPLPVELLDKYINGTCSVAEAAEVENWYLSFEDEPDGLSGLDAASELELRERIYNEILSGTAAEDNVVSIERPWYLKTWLVSSAAAAIIVVGGLLFYRGNHQATTPQVAYIQQPLVNITNNTGQIYKATLPDNSSVWLNPRATLIYPKAFAAGSRDVTIMGECFFEVTKNPARPFIISSRNIVTKVWGTSFLVRDNAESNLAEVSVLTGKVSVRIKDAAHTAPAALTLEKGEVMLYPHQKAVYLVNEHILKPESEPVAPELQIYKRVHLLFENKPLKEIIPVLNANFDVHIKVTAEKLNHYIMNADMEGFNLPDVLEALKKSLNVNYEIKNNSIELE